MNPPYLRHRYGAGRRRSEDSVVRLVVVPGKCQPIEAPQIHGTEQAAEVRRLHCRYYRGCLQRADALRWASFSCRQCSVTEELSRVEERHDMVAMAAMWRASSKRLRFRLRVSQQTED